MLTEKKRYWIVLQKAKGVLTDQEIASAQQVTRMTVHRLWTSYQRGGKETLASQSPGRKINVIPRELQHRILQLRRKEYGIHKIRALLEQKGLQISKQKITKILQAHHLDCPAPEKGKRYHYIRWERKHSNSLWQTDYCWVERLGCWITAWLDDHSRLITAAEYVREATTENSIALFEQGVKRFGLPRETLSDRGCQYYSNHPGNPSSFFEYMKQRQVRHIYSSVKKPTTCEKMERWWRTHRDERWPFPSLQAFVRHYNCKRPHMSLGYQTPYEVWKRDLKV